MGRPAIVDPGASGTLAEHAGSTRPRFRRKSGAFGSEALAPRELAEVCPHPSALPLPSPDDHQQDEQDDHQLHVLDAAHTVEPQ